MQACPKCDGEIDETVETSWGEPQKPYPFPIAPYICTLCGSLLLIEIETGELHIPTKECIAPLKANAVLWKAITEAQSLVAKLPDRRPVLR
jgi:hypothetical protein